jgi:hypothetical protein
MENAGDGDSLSDASANCCCSQSKRKTYRGYDEDYEYPQPGTKYVEVANAKE